MARGTRGDLALSPQHPLPRGVGWRTTAGGRAHGFPPACGLTQSLTPECISALGSAEWLCISNFGLESGVAFADKEEMQPG